MFLAESGQSDLTTQCMAEEEKGDSEERVDLRLLCLLVLVRSILCTMPREISSLSSIQTQKSSHLFEERIATTIQEYFASKLALALTLPVRDLVFILVITRIVDLLIT